MSDNIGTTLRLKTPDELATEARAAMQARQDELDILARREVRLAVGGTELRLRTPVMRFYLDAVRELGAIDDAGGLFVPLIKLAKQLQASGGKALVEPALLSEFGASVLEWLTTRLAALLLDANDKATLATALGLGAPLPPDITPTALAAILRDRLTLAGLAKLVAKALDVLDADLVASFFVEAARRLTAART